MGNICRFSFILQFPKNYCKSLVTQIYKLASFCRLVNLSIKIFCWLKVSTSAQISSLFTDELFDCKVKAFIIVTLKDFIFLFLLQVLAFYNSYEIKLLMIRHLQPTFICITFEKKNCINNITRPSISQ